MKAWLIWLVYAIVTAILAVIGFFIGKKSGKGPCYALVGATVGVVLSLILWFAWGEKAAK
jgi:hypothetical protein